MKKRFVIQISLFLHLFPALLQAQALAGSYYDFLDATKDMPAGHDKTQLIIYRPQNSEIINEIRCFLRIED